MSLRREHHEEADDLLHLAELEIEQSTKPDQVSFARFHMKRANTYAQMATAHALLANRDVVE